MIKLKKMKNVIEKEFQVKPGLIKPKVAKMSSSRKNQMNTPTSLARMTS